MGRKKIQIARINDERNRQVCEIRKNFNLILVIVKILNFKILF